MRLRYIGPTPVIFMTLGITVEPGDEFTVPDEAADSFLARPDVEAVTEPPAEPTEPVEREVPRTKTRSKTTQGQDASPESE